MNDENNKFAPPLFNEIDNFDISIDQVSDRGFDPNGAKKNKPDPAQIEAARNWINQFFTKTNNGKFYTDISSYGMKHWLQTELRICYPKEETYPRIYVTNGAFITAMIEEGYIARLKEDEDRSPNPYFDVNPTGYFEALGQTMILNNPKLIAEEGQLNVIESYNFEGYCFGQFCGRKATHYYSITWSNNPEHNIIGGLTISFCLQHGAFYMGIQEAKSFLIRKLLKNSRF